MLIQIEEEEGRAREELGTAAGMAARFMGAGLVLLVGDRQNRTEVLLLEIFLLRREKEQVGGSAGRAPSSYSRPSSGNQLVRISIKLPSCTAASDPDHLPARKVGIALQFGK